jgi:hypothetical protein
MSPRIGNGGGLLNAANDTEDVPHRPNICDERATPRDEREAREQRQRLVVQVYGQDFAPRHSSQPDYRQQHTMTGNTRRC